MLPNSLTADRLSILSVYPERQRAHLLSYVSLRSTARAETSIGHTKDSFMRHQEVEDSGVKLGQKIGTLVQDSQVQLRDMVVDPWHPTTYVKEVFLDTPQLPRILENTWHVTGKEMTYLGNVTLDTDPEPEPSTALPPKQVTRQIPAAKELSGTREVVCANPAVRAGVTTSGDGCKTAIVPDRMDFSRLHGYSSRWKC